MAEVIEVPVVRIGDEDYYSVTDAAALMGHSRQWVHALIARGRLDVKTRGNTKGRKATKFYVSRRSVERLIK